VASGTLDGMPSAYFDTTLYDDIAKSEVPAGDLDAVRLLIGQRQILAYPS
jgi:hypothetical protein